MGSEVRVSVVTPTKNRLKLLCETMDSVRVQTFGAWEHLIVDDGSDDGTAEEVERRAQADRRIRYIRRKGQKAGASVCRNLGIKASRGDFIVFLDSDDLLDQGCLARRVELMDRNRDLDFAVFQTGVFLNQPGDLQRQLDPEILGDDLLRFLYFEPPWQTSAPIWRRPAVDRLGGFDEALPSWQDVDLHVRAIALNLRYLRFPNVDHHFRWQFEPTKISVEQRRSPRHLDAALATLEKLERTVRCGPGMNWNRQRALCSLYFFVAEQWVALNRRADALRTWRRVRERSLGSRFLHLSGAALLAMLSLQDPAKGRVGRLVHKWKGIMRLRMNAELVAR